LTIKVRAMRQRGIIIPIPDKPRGNSMAGAKAVGVTAAGGFALALAALNLGDPATPTLPAGPALPTGTAWSDAAPSLPAATPTAEGSTDALRATFTLCKTSGGTNCVVDGDTFWFEGRKIRIADIDTPETHQPQCAEEAARGEAATRRMHALLNAGPFSLASADRDTDRYGRALRVVTRGGDSLGGTLVDEGLARWYASGWRGWC
jgi:endonuclease YncB( thermonuclease family)